MQPLVPLPPAPHGALVTSTAKLPPPLRRFGADAAGNARRASPLHIAFPPNGASLELSGRPEAPDSIAVKISGGTAPLSVLVNGVPLDVRHNARTLFFAPDGPGFVRLTVTDATGAADSVVVRLQ
jgi:penicillin-binding protein 1C